MKRLTLGEVKQIEWLNIDFTYIGFLLAIPLDIAVRKGWLNGVSFFELSDIINNFDENEERLNKLISQKIDAEDYKLEPFKESARGMGLNSNPHILINRNFEKYVNLDECYVVKFNFDANDQVILLMGNEDALL